MDSTTLLKEGRTCWRIENCRRAAFLIDGEAYYSALASALERAERAVYIVGWDIDSRVRLRRDGKSRELPDELGAFLNALASARKRLEIFILDWDFSMLYSLEREPLPLFKFGWRSHRRVHFAMDGNHPVGASHHQKMVVVDDRVAFVGGFDLARGRWDTPAHEPEEERRCDNGRPYPPFHDVQMLVEGPAAAALGELARMRWHRATGRELKPPRSTGGDPWPEGVEADLDEVPVAISRTEPPFEDHPGACEVKHLYLEAIAQARSSIYIENQYLTSAAVGEALAARLSAEGGPEVILVLPRECSGWLEETTMGVLRSRLLKKLREADRYGRLRVYYPAVADPDDVRINVHAKVLIVDDELVRVGSSNLNNRSMGLDTECDLAVQAGGRKDVHGAIGRFRDRLLAEHLGVPAVTVARTAAEEKSLAGTVERLRGNRRSLEPLQGEVDKELDELVPDSALIDPERPVDIDELLDGLFFLESSQGKHKGGGGKGKFLLPAVLSLALVLTALWQWTPLGDWIDLQTLISWGREFGSSPVAPALTVGIFLLGGFVLFPVTVLILATALTFGPVLGFCYAMAGAVASAALSFGIGHWVGRDTVRKVAGSRIDRLSRMLAERGVLAVAAVRLLPVAPFSVVNMVAGASHIGFRDFFIGTVLGMAPGVLAISAFEEGLLNALLQPEAKNFLILAGVLAVIAAGIWGLRRWMASNVETGGGSSAREIDKDG